MALTTGDIIIQSRSLDAGFNEERHPDSVCLSFLDRYQRQLLLKISEIDPAAYYGTFRVNLPWTDPLAGEPITDDYLRITGAQTWDRADRQWIITTIARYADRLRNFYVPAIYIAKRTVFPVSPSSTGTNKEWSAYDYIDIDYVPQPTPVTDPSADLFFEDEAEECYVNALGDFLARRGASEVSSPPAMFTGMHQMSEMQFLNRYAFDGGVQVTQTEEIW